MTFTSVTPQDLSVASVWRNIFKFQFLALERYHYCLFYQVEESYSDDKLGTFNLDDGDLSVSVSVKPGMSESGQDVKSIVKAIEDGSLVSSLKLHGLGEVSVYDPLDYSKWWWLCSVSWFLSVMCRWKLFALSRRNKVGSRYRSRKIFFCSSWCFRWPTGRFKPARTYEKSGLLLTESSPLCT